MALGPRPNLKLGSPRIYATCRAVSSACWAVADRAWDRPRAVPGRQPPVPDRAGPRRRTNQRVDRRPRDRAHANGHRGGRTSRQALPGVRLPSEPGGVGAGAAPHGGIRVRRCRLVSQSRVDLNQRNNGVWYTWYLPHVHLRPGGDRGKDTPPLVTIPAD